MKAVLYAFFFTGILTGCSTGRVSSLNQSIESILILEDAKRRCAEVMANRTKSATSAVDSEADQISVSGTLLKVLPKAEGELFKRAADRIGTEISPLDSDAIPTVLSQLGAEFEAANICASDNPRLDMYIFADQLNIQLQARGLDTDALFPPQGLWEGMQTSARILVAIVRRARERGGR